jgi:hypothetical protein
MQWRKEFCNAFPLFRLFLIGVDLWCESEAMNWRCLYCAKWYVKWVFFLYLSSSLSL